MADPPKTIPNPAASGPSQSAELLQVSMVASFTGPLPHPALLKGYEEVRPGAAQRIIAMAESQGAHRRQLEVKMSAASVSEMNLQFTENKRGQTCAVVVALAFLGAGV